MSVISHSSHNTSLDRKGRQASYSLGNREGFAQKSDHSRSHFDYGMQRIDSQGSRPQLKSKELAFSSAK